MNWEVEKLKAKGMRIKMLMILTFQLPLIKMGSNSLLKKKKRWGPIECGSIKRKIRTSTLIFVFRIYICWELRPPPPSRLRRCVRSFALYRCIMVWDRDTYIYIYIYIYTSLITCTSAMKLFFLAKKICVFILRI